MLDSLMEMDHMMPVVIRELLIIILRIKNAIHQWDLIRKWLFLKFTVSAYSKVGLG